MVSLAGGICWDSYSVHLFLDRAELMAGFKNIYFFGTDQMVAGPVGKDEALRVGDLQAPRDFFSLLGSGNVS